VKPFLIVRPEPGAAATLAAARTMGLKAEALPLFTIEPVAWDIPTGTLDGILAGSANAFRHGGSQLAALTHWPVFAVGQVTALAAEQAGFRVAAIGTGGLQAVLDQVPAVTRRLLRLAGQERVELEPPEQIVLTERVVYASRPVPATSVLVSRLAKPSVVALHSAEAARHLAHECDRLGLDRTRIALACIGPRVAGAAGMGWAEVHSAASPEDTALLALAAEMCQTRDQ
jgi:uroporphyrinogen-III synthase